MIVPGALILKLGARTRKQRKVIYMIMISNISFFRMVFI